ncbi:MAG: hypothetical protein EHM36_00180 [Deltaproteobacteria bacterium]|nr:MAG: hypothetical protein EHM36_00180 [Deltaproteobacteria bacterium]
MEEEKDKEVPKVSRTDVQLKATELIFGNPVVLGLIVLGVLGLAVICVPYSMQSKEISIPLITGVGSLAGGIAIGRLSK